MAKITHIKSEKMQITKKKTFAEKFREDIIKLFDKEVELIPPELAEKILQKIKELIDKKDYVTLSQIPYCITYINLCFLKYYPDHDADEINKKIEEIYTKLQQEIEKKKREINIYRFLLWKEAC